MPISHGQSVTHSRVCVYSTCNHMRKNATTRTSYSVNMIDSIERINKMYLVVYWNLKRQPICFPMDHLCGYRIIISGYNGTKYLNIQFKSSSSSSFVRFIFPKALSEKRNIGCVQRCWNQSQWRNSDTTFNYLFGRNTGWISLSVKHQANAVNFEIIIKHLEFVSTMKWYDHALSAVW